MTDKQQCYISQTSKSPSHRETNTVVKGCIFQVYLGKTGLGIRPPKSPNSNLLSLDARPKTNQLTWMAC